MNVLIYLVPMALLLGLTSLIGFHVDLEDEPVNGAALRILPDDDVDGE